MRGGGPYTIQITNLPLNGANIGTYNGDEAEVVLDIAQAIGMAPGMSQVRVYFAPDAWTTSGNDVFPSSNDDLAILNQMVADAPPYGAGCNQLSMSWNWRPENPLNDQDEGVFQTMQGIGQSFFNASGDYGSWITNSTCSYGSCFVYPEESPNVIAVGGTDLTTSRPGGSWASESGWSNSGGGISPDLFPIPSYQSGLSGINGTSTTYRNAPDVAMEANWDNYVCSLGSCAAGWGGTSFAAPRWAGFMALVNQQAVANGKSAIGFLNPYIYPIGEGPNYLTDFNEIVGGSNGAYSVVTGQYNMVTGWGSPNGQNLIDVLAAEAPPPPVSYSPTSVSCVALSGKGAYVTNPAGPETQNGGYAEMRTIIQTLHGTLLDAQCTWSGFPAVVTTTPLTLEIPISYGQQQGSSATLSVSGLAYFDYTSNYNGTELIIIPSGTHLSTLSVTGVAIATGGVGDNSELYVGWIDIY